MNRPCRRKVANRVAGPRREAAAKNGRYHGGESLRKAEEKELLIKKLLLVKWNTWRRVSRSAWVGDLRSSNSDLLIEDRE